MEDYTANALATVTIDDARAANAGASGKIVTRDDAGGTRAWANVLPLMDAAADEMRLGDLLEGKAFDMQDAMSALEMMDPQMDTGMKKEADAATADEPIPPPPTVFGAPLLIGLLDDVLCAEHGWYRGLTLAQTVYAVEWVQCAPEIVDLPARAALVAVARGVAAARSIVMRGDIHEEEDFASSLSGLDLHDEVTDAELAVACRVRFRRGLCGALLNMARASEKALEMARKMLKLAEEALDAMSASTDLGTPREELTYCLEGRAVRKVLGAAPAKKPPWLSREEGFKATRQFLAELRSICAFTDVSDEYDGFVRWLNDLVGLPRPAPFVLSRSAAQLLGVTEDPRQSPGLRPMMVEYLSHAIGIFSGLEPGLIRELCALAPVADLVSQCAHGEVARLRLMTINRGRQRRRLRHYLSDWAPLQELAETLDMQLQHAGYLQPGTGPYGAWCLHRTIRDMLRFILLGFELELYAPCEYAFVYWYMDLLCGMALQLVKEVADKANAQAQALADAEEAERQAALAAAQSAGGKKSRKAIKARATPSRDAKRPVVVGSLATHIELLFVRAQLDMSRGCYLLLEALELQGYVPEYESEFMPLARRFERRFAPFRCLARPPPLDASHFAKARASLRASPDVLPVAANHFKAVKMRLDAPLKAEARSEMCLTSAQRAEAMAMLKAAVANSVLIASLSLRPPPAGARAKCSFDTHGHFVTVAMEAPKTAGAADGAAAAAAARG